MLYELSIAFSAVAISFVLYFSFLKLFQNDRRNEDDEITFDERRDLDGKELLYVSVVRPDTPSPFLPLHPLSSDLIVICHF